MIQVTSHTRIVVAVEPVDFRNGIDGLARICKEVLKADPFAGWLFCVSEPARHGDKGTLLRRPGILADPKTVVVGEVSLLARKPDRGIEHAGSAPTAGAAGGGRSDRGHRSTGMEPCESGRSEKLKIGLAFRFCFCYRARHGNGAEVPRTHDHRARDLEFIRALIAENPGLSRRALSSKLCEAWNWRQANGALCDMVCRGLMLHLHRAGHIELPPVRWVNPNPLARRNPERKQAGAGAGGPDTARKRRLSEIRPLEFAAGAAHGRRKLFNSLLDRYHYLGYTQPVGEHLKYVVYAQDRPIACLGWSSAPRHLGPRDRFIGWSAEARRKNIRFLAYNTRFLILPVRQG